MEHASTYIADRIDEDGFLVLSEGLTPEGHAYLVNLVESMDVPPRSHRRGGIRDIFRRVPALIDVTHWKVVRWFVDEALSENAFAVRGIIFDKTPESNWHVAWHQDTTIAVKAKHEVEGFGPWSVKEGIDHVRPPADVLDRMLTVRIHLDETWLDNGPLRVIPGSHRNGIMAKRPSADHVASCWVVEGGIVFMKPLLWHESNKATEPSHRRVIHIEFADIELPDPLEWHERW